MVTQGATGPTKASKFPWINTWAVEYYYADAATAQKDAQYFDIHLSPQNVIAIKAAAPNSIAVLYNIWREQYANDDPGAVKERAKIDAWCSTNGKNKENFYCHYGRDVTIKSQNLSTGLDEYKIIPGWDPANDPNGDGVRDWASDYGQSSGVGGGYLSDSTKSWGTNKWANATLVDKNGTTFKIIGNTATKLTLASGTPASGRYGISASGSPDNFATAKTKADARVQTYIWQAYAYAMNIGDPYYQAYRAYDAQKVIITGDTTWDPEASTLWDGYMVDNTQPEFPWPEIMDGKEVINEYPDKNQWRADQVTLFQAVKAALGPYKFVWGNTGNYDYYEIAQAGGGQHQEMEVAVTNEHGPKQWDYWKQLSDQGLYSTVYPSWDCWPDQSDRERMHYLAFHYMGQQPYIYLGFRGFGYDDVFHWDPTPYDWLPAAGVDVGMAVDDMYQQAATGTDPAGQNYSIYIRHYTKALIVCRPKLNWSDEVYDSSSAVTFNLPSYNTSTGQSNSYKPLKADGTFGTAVTKVTLRNPESFILFPANGSDGGGDITPPQISAIQAANITSTNATLTWTTNESATSTVDYGVTTSYGVQAVCTDQGTVHSAALSGLQPSTIYHCRVKCTDSAGNTATSNDYTFTTSADGSGNPGTGSVGFIRDWLLLGAFTDTGSGFDQSYIGEYTVHPYSNLSMVGKTWKPYHGTTDLVNLQSGLANGNYLVGYAHVYIYSPADLSCKLLLGSDDGVKVYLNGDKVHSNNVSRSASPDDDSVQVTLLKGWNRLLVKVTQEEGAWGFYARFVDDSGCDLQGLTYALDNPMISDRKAPSITNIAVKLSATGTSAVVTWQTDKASNSVVQYGPTTTYGKSGSSTTPTLDHSVTITGLKPGTTSHIRVRSTDIAGNIAVSDDIIVMATAGTAVSPSQPQ